MPYDDVPFNPLALLSKSFRIGRPFGVEVRVYVTAIIVVLVAAAQWNDVLGISPFLAAAIGLAETLVLYTVVYVHEMGHVAAGWRYDIRTPTITLSAFGGLAHMSSGAPNPATEIKIALAGPATHGLWIAVAWPLAQFVPPVRLGTYGIPFDTFGWIWQMNLGFLLFNLLPAFPMDGGRVLRGALAHRMHPNRATLIACRIGIVAAIALAVCGIQIGKFYGGILIMIALSNVFVCLREMAAARHTDGPYAPVDPWSNDGEEWKRGVTPERHAEIAAEVLGTPPIVPRDDEELDRLLDRVRDVGVGGLSSAERRRLNELAALHRPRT